MSSRMEKYGNSTLNEMSRTKRNQEVYNSMNIENFSDIPTNNNVSVISDAHKEIDLEKIKKFVYSLENKKEERKNRISLELPQEETKIIERKEVKDYDINSILERAKDNRESNYEEDRLRKFNNTQIDILKNIKIKDEQLEIEKDEDITSPIEELNTEEKTIVDLIKDIQNKESKKEIFQELLADDDETIVTSPIDQESTNDDLKQVLFGITQDLESIKIPDNDFTQEINAEKSKYKTKTNEYDDFGTESAPKIKEIDKSFYTNSMTFNKSDFEGFEDVEKNDGKNSALTKIAIVFIILLLAATIFLILNFVLDWNII